MAITSSFHPEPDTHVEPVRYAAGSNLMGLLSTVLTDGGGRAPRWVSVARRRRLRHPVRLRAVAVVRHWSERTIIGLVMQPLDNSLVVSGRRGLSRPLAADDAAGSRRAQPVLDPGRQRARSAGWRSTIGGTPAAASATSSARR